MRYRVKLRQSAEVTVTVRADSMDEAAQAAIEGVENDEFGTEPFRDERIEVVAVRVIQ